MSYINTQYGNHNLWNVENGVADTDLAAINIKNTSNPARLDLQLVEGNDVWDVVAFGSFDLSNGPKTAADLIRAEVTNLLVKMNGNSDETIEYGPGFNFVKWLTSYDYRYSLLSGDDIFIGSLETANWGDQVRTGSGNDHFSGYNDGSGANGERYFDSFFGDSGIDTAHYRGSFSNYTVTKNAEIWDARYDTQTVGISVVDSIANRDGTDWLKDVERLEFNDINLALDTGKGEIAGSAYRLYKAAFDRAAEADGLGFWINTLDNGANLVDVAQGFINSAEFTAMYGANPTDQQFVTLLYNHVLHRPPEGEGYQFWLNSLSAGVSRAEVLRDFSESTENIAQTAGLVANGIQYDAWI